MSKPKIFVGSSSEARDPARMLCSVLADAATMIPWWDAPEFTRGSFSTLDALVVAVDSYDFGVFLLTADDLLRSRGKSSDAPRDNVVFEFGIFLGRLGPRRAMGFVQKPAGKAVKIPSDLLGIHMPTYQATRDEHELRAALGHATETVRAAIRLSPDWWQLNLEIVRSWGIDRRKATFSVKLAEAQLRQFATKLQNRSLLLVVRQQDDHVSRLLDTRIAIGKPRSLGVLESDVLLNVRSTAVIAKCKPGKVIEACVFAVPSEANIQDCETIGDLIANGARLAKIVGEVCPRL
ncbi:MAG TPA: TIR domain-containing protein [Bryobacteraceae bacterium]|nr:TIR domain-containing protein [Bryobacteraceae bacterium]